MLDFLRKNASSWLSKGIFALIALIFALYFGFTKGRNNQGAGATTPIARVNGDNIPAGLFNTMVSNQMEIYQRLGNADKGPELQQLLQTQVLQRLISQALLSQEGHRLGLHISDAELANAIRSDGSFQKNGSFDETFYLEQFKPFYERQNGQNFEYGLREDLLQDRLKQVFQQTDVISQAALQDELKVQGTELKVIKVAIPYFNPGEGRSKEEATQLANEWIAARQNKKSAEDILKKNQIEATEIGPKPLQAFVSFFGGTGGLPILSCILATAPGQVCPQAYPMGGNMVAVEVTEKNQKAPDPEAAKAMESQLKVAKQNIILGGVTNYLTKHAKIETFLNQ